MKKLSVSLSKSKGQSLVEMAIMLPILLIILVGIVELGFALANQMTVTTSAREGARYGARFGPTNDSEVNDAILEVVQQTSSKRFPLDADHADVFVIRAKTDASGNVDGGSTNFGADSYYVWEQLLDDPDLSGAPLSPGKIAADLEPDTAVIIVQAFYDHRSTMKLPIVATLSDQIPIASYTVMRIEPSLTRPVCCLFPFAVDNEVFEDAESGDHLVAWASHGSTAGNSGWLRWDPAHSSGSQPALVHRLEHPCEATRDYVNPNDSSDTTIDPGDPVRGDTGTVASVTEQMDWLCGATTDSDYRSNKGNDYCEADSGYDGKGARQIRLVVYDTTQGTGSNFLYQVYRFAIVRILDYHLPQGGNPSRLDIQFIRWDDDACGIQ